MFPHRSRRGSPSLLAAEGAQLGTTLIRSDVCRSTAFDVQVVELEKGGGVSSKASAKSAI